MSTQDEIRKAIAAHGLWKSRLRAALQTGKSEFTVESVAADDKCEFGRWLGEQRFRGAQAGAGHYENVKRLHSAFHKEVAKVLSQALTGKPAEALDAMGLGSDYARCSADLTVEMLAWAGAEA